MEKNKLLVVCGPTATGKTSLALHLAKLFEGELVSADSRQVYRYLDIGTGKDIPINFSKEESNISYKDQNIYYYTNFVTRIWGYDIVDPDKEFNVSEYAQIAHKIILDIVSRKKLPILVGGSGLYISSLVDGIETSHIKPNESLREKLSTYSTDELYKKLSKLDREKALSMNNSDKNNPRRLVRAIEIALSKDDFKLDFKQTYDTLHIGLQAAQLTEKIVKRVNSRIEEGFENEVANLKEKGYLELIPKSTLGYKEWIEYLDGKSSRENSIRNWIQAEKNYAKRQMTWFKKDKRIHWYDAAAKDTLLKVEKLVCGWHNSTNRHA